MLLHLVKKDFLLAKKYWIVMIAIAVAMPVFLHIKAGFIAGQFFGFFLSTLYIVFLLFNTVSMMEYKYKGSALLCAAPYTREAIVKAKYAFALAIFVGCYILYTLIALLVPFDMELLRFSEIGGAFFILSVIFGAVIPIQYRFGYEKSRLIFMCLIFFTPFVLPSVMKMLQQDGLGFHLALPFPQTVQDVLLVGAALFIGWISMGISVRIYSEQSL